jgi:hypothetical protein
LTSRQILLLTVCIDKDHFHAFTEDFLVIKAIAVFGVLPDCLKARFGPAANAYFDLFLDNADTAYAEVSKAFFLILNWDLDDLC